MGCCDKTNDCYAARADADVFYHGVAVIYRKDWFVLHGPPAVFVPGHIVQPVLESRGISPEVERRTVKPHNRASIFYSPNNCDTLPWMPRLFLWPLTVLLALALTGGGLLYGSHDHKSGDTGSGHRHAVVVNHGHASHDHGEHRHGDLDGLARASASDHSPHCCGHHHHPPSRLQWIAVSPRGHRPAVRDSTAPLVVVFTPGGERYTNPARLVHPPPRAHAYSFVSHLRSVVLLI